MIYDVAYAAYGETYAETGTQDRVFAGMEQDIVSSGSYPLYDALMREYHPTWGRWVSPDPAGLAAANPANPQSWNRYAYVVNNPLSFIDPLGLYTWQAGNCVYNTVAVYVDGVFQGYDTILLFCYSGYGGGPPPSGGMGGAGASGSGSGSGGGAANNGTPQQPTKTQERLERLKNCALGYYGIDPLSVSGLTSNGAKWGLIAAGAGGIPKAIPEGLGLVRTIRPPGSSSFTSLFSIISATSGGGALRTVANFGSKWAGPIAIASAVIDATAIGICTAMD